MNLLLTGHGQYDPLAAVNILSWFCFCSHGNLLLVAVR